MSIASWLALGCAEGMPGPEASTSNPLMAAPQPVAGMAGPATAGVGGGAAGRAAAPPSVFSGQACQMGETQDCTCDDGVSQGVQICRFDMASPTDGAFGPCSSCQTSGPGPAAGTGASGTGGGAGTSSTAGTGGGGTGSAGTGSSGTGSSGTGSSGTGSSGTGSSGTGGSGGSGGQMPPAGCDPDDCDEPLLGSACCTDDDECGVRLLLSCNPR